MSATPSNLPQTPSTRMIAVPLELAPVVERMIADFDRGTPIAPLQYASPVQRARPLIDIPLAIALAMFAAVLTFLMVAVVPRFEDIFKDFGTKLPAATVKLLNVSRFVDRDYGWVLLWAIVFVIPIAVARLRPWPPKRPMRGRIISIFLAVFLIGAALTVTYILLQLPIITLIQSVSGNPKKGG